MRRLPLALLVALAVPASAPAADQFTTGTLAERGLVLVEDGVVWTRLTHGGNGPMVMGPGPAGTAHALLRPTYGAHLSSNGIVAAVAAFPRVYAGPFGTDMPPVYVPPGICQASEAEIDGDVLAASVGCGGSTDRVVVRRPGVPERVFPTGNSEIEAAGPYVAWTAPDQSTVVLYDAVADREVMRTTRPGGKYLYPLELQPDGKLLLGLGYPRSDLDADTAWVSPADRRFHRLGIPPLAVHGFARDRILTLTFGRSIGDQVGQGTPEPSRAELVGLDGSRRPVGSVRGAAEIIEADYDGRRVALGVATCAGTRMAVRSAADRPLTLTDPVLCPVDVVEAPTLSFGPSPGRRGVYGVPRVRAAVRCGFRTPRDCGQLQLRRAGRLLTSESYDLANGYTLTLTEAALRWIAQKGSMRVRLEMRWESGADAPMSQTPTTSILRVGAEELARLRRCLRVRRSPTVTGCPA